MEKFGVQKIDQEKKRILENLDFTEYEGSFLPDWANPYTNTYMGINALLFIGCAYSRHI
jgi:hypothetical protein